MSEKIDTIISSLIKFGLTNIEAKVYLTILGGRGDTALAISRDVNLARTKVYRILDSLIAKGFVTTGQGDRGLKFMAAPPESLELIIKNKESELRSLRSSLPKLVSELDDLEETVSGPIRVHYYHGQDGLKQVTYNSTRGKGELLTYELETMNSFLTRDEAEDFRRRFVENKVHIRTLTTASYLEAWTDIPEIVDKYWDIRHLDPGSRPFQFEILIYNDVYCMYRYTGRDIFCVEIHSSELADQQRAIFERVWDTAHKFKILDAHGTAKIA